MKWYDINGEQSDIVISTRVRLARNLREYPFPSRLDTAGREEVAARVRAAFADGGRTDLGFIDMRSLSRLLAISFAERHIISPEFTTRTPGSALMLTEDESVSVMICEEDHIRLQVIKPGLDLEAAYREADELDDILNSKLNFAFDKNLGYLTQCPTNLGTAMRASVMLHLPALTAKGRINGLASTVSKLGLVIRGAYGEGSKPMGDVYQLSNQITLGISEDAAIGNLKSIALQLVEQERKAASELAADPDEQDRIFRALGLLKYARKLSSKEFMELISIIRLGASTGVLEIPAEKLNALVVNLQPATISAANPETPDAAGRDALRAEAVRAALSDCR